MGNKGKKMPNHPESPCMNCNKTLVCEGTKSMNFNGKHVCKEWVFWFNGKWQEIRKAAGFKE